MNATTNGSNNKNAANVMAMLERIRANPKIVLIISVAAVSSLVAALFFWAKAPDYRVLYSTISDQEGGAVVAQLDQMKVPYKFQHGGTIMVPDDRVYETRLKLAQLGLPKGGAVGFELLDREKFGISQFGEQVNFQRALEGELSRTIETLGPVQSVRVHLAIPKPSLFVHEQKPPSASVTLTLLNGRTLDAGQVNAISWLLSSAIPGLAADKVTILDQNGHLLTQSGSQAVQTSQLKYTNDVETDYQNRIQAILAPIMGRENVRAQVTAQIDFTAQEQTQEQYQPNSKPEEMSVRSRQTSQSEQGGKSAQGGVPGALSNQPPVPATASIDKAQPTEKSSQDKSGKSENTARAGDKLTPFSNRKDETTNYELNRTLTHIKNSASNIKRLSVAVVVNYQPGKVKGEGEDAVEEETTLPLSKEQMDQINALVKEAIGYSAERGDTLNIVNSPFLVAEEDSVLKEFWKQPAFIDLMLSAGRYLLVALVAWTLWRKAVKPAWQRQQAYIRERLDLEKAAREEEVNAAKAQNESRERAKMQQRVDAEVIAQQLRDTAEQDPKVIALVIRQWLNKEQQPS
ncbi:flagellar MS-ring protein [Erwinia typographi]|uniref:Flagellar M-ring protein n=1 Tax=Erwinia typographi TaxID=371042 RepID=A0A0A3Z6F1_9GAMM|nr:flagellar basal-body MS-ring/collar protein FliF [Erwinia typographi]KGT93339.1 flagellar MS-ring protein [Erwinia typographi]